MKVLQKLRPVVLLTSAGTGIGAFVALWLREDVAFIWLIYLAHVAFFLFLLAESFGELAEKRTKFNRNLARLLLLPLGVFVVGMSLFLLRGT